MLISDIGTTGNDSALLCHTNDPAAMTGGRIHSGGHWFNQSMNEVVAMKNVGGFRRNI